MYKWHVLLTYMTV